MMLLFIVICMVFVFVVLYQLFGSREATIKREIGHLPRVLIDQFPESAVGKIVGRLVYVDEPLRAPLTGRCCAQYRVIVEEYRSSGNSGSWHTIIEDEKSRDFMLWDETGEALVRMSGAQVAVTKDTHYRSGTFNDATPLLESFLAKHRHQSTGVFFNKNLRYKEGVLEEGEEVAICGMGRWENYPDPSTPSTASGSHDERSKLLIISNSKQVPLYVSDDYKILEKRNRATVSQKKGQISPSLALERTIHSTCSLAVFGHVSCGSPLSLAVRSCCKNRESLNRRLENQRS